MIDHAFNLIEIQLDSGLLEARFNNLLAGNENRSISLRWLPVEIESCEIFLRRAKKLPESIAVGVN